MPARANEPGFSTLRLLSLLLELLDRSLIDTAALEDQVAGGGGLAGIDVTDDDDVELLLILGHIY